MTKKQKKMLSRILITAVMLAALYFLPVAGWLRLALYLAAYLVIGYDILKKAGQGILNGRVFDENFLMAVATVGAFALAIYEKSGDYNEAIAVMLFYQIGELFQSYAVGKSRKNISALMDIRPDYANVERDGQLVQVDPDEVAVGTVIVVQPGEKVPIDGVVVEGSSTLNTSALTGESLPRDACEGDEIISGCINMTGLLKIRTTKEFGESTVSKILELVENSSSRKSRSEDFISYARDIVSAVARAQVFASEETELTGMVQVGTLNSLMTASFSDIVPAFRQRFPHVMMRLHADMVASLKDKLLKNELDLIYTLDSQVLDPQFVKVFEAEEEVVVVTNRDNPLAARESVRLAELVDHPFILMNRTNAYRDLFDTELARQGLEIRPFLELEDDVLALRLLYENPAYMTVLPLYTVKKSIHEKSLAAVRVEDCKMSQFRQVIYHKNKVLTPQIQGMLDTIVEVAKRPF